MARVVLTQIATDDLDDLIRTHGLPDSTTDRFRSALLSVASFPDSGTRLGDDLNDLRFVLGPWRWMVVVYRHDSDSDEVSVLRIADGRASNSPLGDRSSP